MANLSYPLDLVSLQPDGATPLYRQLCEQLRDLVLDGKIRAGSRLPSIRAFAHQLTISRNTVISALDQLAAEGLLESRRGSGVYVSRIAETRSGQHGPAAALPSPSLSSRGQLMAGQPRVRTFPRRSAFHPGTPELAEFPFKIWSRLLARRARFGGQDLFGYHYTSGHPELRKMIAASVGTMRRVRCSPEQIVVTTGGQAALDLLARLLLDPGDIVWMEEPGYLGARSAFLAAGAEIAPLPVTRAGWRVPDTADPPPRVIYLTPSCQHPLGITMPLEQRLAVHDIADQANAWVIEDDFDGEYTFRGQPLPAMQGLRDSSNVIYVGTFSKTLFPALRLGFMALPENLADKIKPALSVTGQFAPLVLQAALADFISQGFFFAHLNRMRRLYSRRRRHFLDLLASELGAWLDPIDGRTGIQIASLFKGDVDDREVVRLAGAAGVNLAPLSLYFIDEPQTSGLLMGYAGVSEADMDLQFPVLRKILAGLHANGGPANTSRGQLKRLAVTTTS